MGCGKDDRHHAPRPELSHRLRASLYLASARFSGSIRDLSFRGRCRFAFLRFGPIHLPLENGWDHSDLVARYRRDDPDDCGTQETQDQDTPDRLDNVHRSSPRLNAPALQSNHLLGKNKPLRSSRKLSEAEARKRQDGEIAQALIDQHRVPADEYNNRHADLGTGAEFAGTSKTMYLPN